ncbi:MAG TPA: CpaF family protein [Candidatus Tectomicrobia bacterium]|jgi:pilus assembly protein CpaF
MVWSSSRLKKKLKASENHISSISEEKENKRQYIYGSEYQNLKSRIHDKLLDSIDLSLLESLEQHVLWQEISKMTEEVLKNESIALNLREKERLVREVPDEVLGLGPLEAFLHDPTISDILVNTHNQIYIERFGKLERTEARFRDDGHLRKIIDKIVSPLGRRIDESSPMVDARLPDGSRVNAIIPPLAIDGPILSIRRFAVDPLRLSDLITLKTVTPEIGELLQGIVRARLNVLIAGGTGSGKTTLLNVLSGFIPVSERIITIEDSAELQLQQAHVIRLETRPANIEGKGQITQRDLVRNSLRMRPDRIIVGEVRGEEVLDMLQAMNTGHEGSLATIHANSARDALIRLETMVALTGVDISAKFLRHYISSALDIIIHISRLADGSRKLMSLQEITGIEGEVMTLQEIFTFAQTGVHDNGSIEGHFKATGIRPQFVERLKALGISIPADIFEARKAYKV